MIGALIYLQLTSLRNVFQRRLLRLRNPRYLIAALVGLAYFYFVFLRRTVPVVTPEGQTAGIPVDPGHRHLLIESFGSFALFAALVVSWIVPNTRGALAFSEAEVAHLFPAPVARRTLVNFKIIKSQLSILLSTILITLISNRWRFLEGNIWLHAAGWWVIGFIYNLHVIGASFTREKLYQSGISVWMRRLAVAAIIGLVGGCTWFFLRLAPPVSSGNDVTDIGSLLDYVQSILSAPPLGWVLFPFRLAIRPFLAPDGMIFLQTLWPAGILAVLHYLWVARSDVAFEEASVELAQRRGEAMAAARAGKGKGATPRRKRREPFTLGAVGFPSFAFLWKSLLAAGPFYYPQYWLVAGVTLVSGEVWLGRHATYRPLIGAVLAFSSAVGAYGLLFGPILARRGLALMLQRLDVAKTYPLKGWQVVLGEMLCPVLILSMFEWIVLSLLITAAHFLQEGGSELSASVLAAGWGGACLLLVPLAAMLFALNYAGALYFPGWIASAVQPGGGFEKVGHRLIFFVGYMVVLVVALLPAAVFAAIPVFLCLCFKLKILAIVTGSFAGCAVLVVELSAAVYWLGRRFEQFDISVELAP